MKVTAQEGRESTVCSSKIVSLVCDRMGMKLIKVMIIWWSLV